MSYDIRVWSVKEPDWTDKLSESDGWLFEDRSCVLNKATWQIVVGPALPVEDGDIPDDVIDKLPGIRYLTEINLEPLGAPQSGHDLLRKIVNRMAKDSHAVVEDPQQGKILTPRGVQRIKKAAAEERASVFQLSWWFNESPVLQDDGLHQLVNTMEKLLPEALPKRYGRFEPPKFRYDDHGKNHFIKFLADEDLFVVWYPHYPVLNVNFGIYSGFGPTRQGYRVNHISITVHASALSQPGWNLALKRFWYGSSEVIKPFYGEVRLMSGYILKRGRISQDSQTETHPVKNGWWKGLPSPMGQAAVIGEPYISCWSRFVKHSKQRDGLYFVSVDDWLSGKTADLLVRGVPKNLAQKNFFTLFRLSEPRTAHSNKWPFNGPFSRGRR
jgi:hypothetical protein